MIERQHAHVGITQRDKPPEVAGTQRPLRAMQPKQRIARGRQLVQKFNCVGCHIVDANAAAVQQYYKADEITTKAPPSLRGEGNKIQHAWLFNFLKNVEPLRPLLYKQPENKPGIRMPRSSWTSGTRAKG